MVNDFIYKKPEEEGLDSKYILQFIDKLKEYKINLHSFMLVRNGNIITEAYYKPFDENFPHRLYSSSKTFVALAIGMMIDEGKLKLTDKLIDFFPEYLDREQDKWMKETTIEDCLKMSIPFVGTAYRHDNLRYDEWAWTTFNILPSIKPAGTLFSYSTSASFILDVLVEKLSGKPFLEYMRPIFDKIGVSRDIWCVKSPDGYSWGGSGVVCTLRDFAKVGELVLDRGEYKGEQLISREYMEKATTAQTINGYDADYEHRANGYGYQIWINDKGWQFLGARGQNVYCFPKKNFMVVCNADTDPSTTHLHFLYAFVSEILENNIVDGQVESEYYPVLQHRLQTLSVDDIVWGDAYSDLEKEINGKKYLLQENPMGWKWFSVYFGEKGGYIQYENLRGVKRIDFGRNKLEKGTFPETHYYDRQVKTPANRQQDCISSLCWRDKNTLLIRTYIIDVNFANCFMTFSFKGDEVGVSVQGNGEWLLDDYTGITGGKRCDCI